MVFVFKGKKKITGNLMDRGWYFPGGKDLEKTSASNAYVETFKDNKIESLAREICQNSLDAADGTVKPVRVTFEMMTVPTNLIPGIEQIVSKIIPKAKETWPFEEKTKKLIKKMEEVLDQKEISVLKISDENTTGLKEENWKSLIEQAGSSVKSGDDSGGSFGIGKAAPFAISDLRMVFYNTLTQSKLQQSIGVMKFVSYDEEDGTTTQGTGYFGQKNKQPFNNGVSFDSGERQNLGTDIYILGFDKSDFSDYKKEIIPVVLVNCRNNKKLCVS